MSTVEAAASLFGPSDSGSEFFTAPESADSTSHSPAEESKNTDILAGHDSSDLFPGASSKDEATSLFDTEGGGHEDFGESIASTQEQNLPWDVQSSQNIHPPAEEHGQDVYYNGDYFNGYDNQEYTGGESQWQGHVDQQPTDYSNAGYYNNSYNSYTPSNDQYGYATNGGPYSDPASRYSDSYTSGHSAQYGYGSEYTPSPAVQQPNEYSVSKSSASVYDPYKLSTYSSPASQSTATSTSSSNGTYDPYKPPAIQRSTLATASSSTLTPSLTSAYSGSITSSATSSSKVEAPKSPVPPFRPAKYDAYDPPIPTVKPKRSTTTHLYQQTPASPSHYASPPPPRPPPLRASTFVPNASSSVLSPPPPPSRASAVFPQRQTLPPPPPPSNSHPPGQSSYNTSASYHYAPQVPQEDPYSPSTTHSDNYGLPPPSMNQLYSPDISKADHVYAQNPADIHYSTSFDNVAHPNNNADASTAAYQQQQQQQVQSYGHFETSVNKPPPSRDNYLGYSPSVPQSDGFIYEDAQVASSSKPISPVHATFSPVSPPQRSLDSPPIRRSPEKPKDVSPPLRGLSPVSESGRSWTGSQGRSSRPASRQGPLSTTQSFASIDEQVARHSEPYHFIPRNIGRMSSPDRRSSLGAVAAAPLPSNLASTHLSYQEQNVIDLASDTSSINGRSSPSPSTSRHQDTSLIYNSQSLGGASAYSSSYEPFKPQQPQTQRSLSPEPIVQHHRLDSYAPPSSTYAHRQNSYDPPVARERSMSNLSATSAFSSRSADPYAASQHQNQNQPDLYGRDYNSAGVIGQQSTYGHFAQSIAPARTSLDKPYSPPPVTGPYAPSPTLLGTNDPLGRANAKIPVINFGFGGKLITCFHSSPALGTGFDVALSSRNSTDVHIRPLHKALPESAVETSAVEYPGPLFGDPGSPVNALVRTTTTVSAKTKTKKGKVLTYLDERAEELQRAIGYLSSGTIDRRRAEGKLVLVRLLRALVEYDGQLHGSADVEAAVQSSLVPNLDASDPINVTMPSALTGSAIASGTFGSASSNERPIVEYAVRPSALNTIQQFLYRGEKVKAYHYALDEKLWAHAMVIAGSIDKEAYKEVVNEFVRTELGTKNGLQPMQLSGRPQPPIMNGWEPLRLAYTLYSGQSSTAVQQLLMTSTPLINGPALTLQPPTPISHLTPLTPNFPSPELAGKVSPEALNKWQEYAAMLYSGQMGTESSAALTTLGDYLRKNGWIEAAHCCYLLSPQSSPIGGVGIPAVRIVLVGSQSPQDDPTSSKDPDGFIFSEIVEFALGLHAPLKGQEPFAGFPHLQAYRLVHALRLAEMGHMSLAKRYCDAINASSSKPSPYLSLLFSEKLKEFSNRLIGDPELDKSKAWISGKIAKPSLDGIGDWLGGTLSRFVAGETESSKQPEDLTPNNPAYAGAFSQYSAISSTNTSKSPSPAPSFVNGGSTVQGLPMRSDSAAGIRALTHAYNPVNRASSAWDYDRPDSRKNTPPPRVASAGASSTTFAQSQTFNKAMDGYSYGSGLNSAESANGIDQDSNKDRQQESGWWSSNANNAYESSAPTPTATSFFKLEGPINSTPDGFISLMDSAPSFAPSSSNYSAAPSSNHLVDDELDDDLGLGNNISKRKQDNSEGDKQSSPTTVEPSKEEPKKPDPKPEPTSSGSWLGRLFSRSSSTAPGPVKANLGNENDFYFDKELGKWINKKAGAEQPKQQAAPPPPSRAQTTSPSRISPHASNARAPPSPMPPPPRPASAMEPPKRSVTTPRIHSNLIPTDATSAPPTPGVISAMHAAPPTGRSKSAATKRNVRSRYVDVFQAQPQENS